MTDRISRILCASEGTQILVVVKSRDQFVAAIVKNDSTNRTMIHACGKMVISGRQPSVIEAINNLEDHITAFDGEEGW